MYCISCGKEIPNGSGFCNECGASQAPRPADVSPSAPMPPAMTCPKCGGSNVDCQVFQENLGSATITKTKSKYRQKGHGCLWWLLIGWWWWIIDLLLWIFLFVPRLLIQIFRKKKYKGSSVSASTTKNKIVYKSIFICKTCGNRWEV